jgi:hypothetical protein
MAIEYLLLGDADCDTAEVQAFFTAEIRGDFGHRGTAFCHGMYVTAHRVADEERSKLAELFGFEHRITATFHLSDLADEMTDVRNTELMVRSVLDLVTRYTCRGVLLFNGDLVIAEWTPSEIVFDSDWEPWAKLELIAGHTVRRLPQPLL